MAIQPRLTADNYLRILADQTHRRQACRARTPSELAAWQTSFRAQLVRMLGLDRIAARGRSDPRPRLLGSVRMPTHIREEWRLTTEPGFELPLFLLRPLRARGRSAVVITPHGHGTSGKAMYAGIYANEDERRQIVDGERDIAVQAVEAGHIAIAPDMRGFAGLRLRKDRENDAVSSCQTLQLRGQLLGRTLIGERVWDVSRIIDWVQSMPACDPARIAITGNSGGGTVSLFAAACDPRIAACVPGCYFCTFVDSIGSIVHCACNYVPELLAEAEMADVAGLIAPRPFLAVAGRSDPIFPLPGVRRAFRDLRRIYTVAGAAGRCRLSIGAGGHRYFKRDVWPFLRRHLGGQRSAAGGRLPARAAAS